MNTFCVRRLFSDAWKDYSKHWKSILLIFLVFGILQFISLIGGHQNMHGMWIQDGVLSLLTSLAGVWLGIGYITFMLNIVDGKRAHFRDIFHGVKSIEQFAYFILVSLVYTVSVLLGLIIFIIPGIIVALGLIFVKYYIAENRLGLEFAFRSSWEITKGNRWKILGFVIIAVIFNLVGLIALGVGLLITAPMTGLMVTRMFRELEGIPLPDAGDDTEE